MFYRSPSPLSSALVLTTSGTFADIVDVPPWAKRVTVMLHDISTSGTGQDWLQLGAGGVIETTGYIGRSSNVGSSTSAFPIHASPAASTIQGAIVLALFDRATNTWVVEGVVNRSDGSVNPSAVGGRKALAGALDRIRFTTSTGDTLDAGAMRALYE